MLKKLLVVPLVLMFAASLTACNTMQGAGKDLERGGEKIQNAADRDKK